MTALQVGGRPPRAKNGKLEYSVWIGRHRSGIRTLQSLAMGLPTESQFGFATT
jgi:hypothetical protein